MNSRTCAHHLVLLTTRACAEYVEFLSKVTPRNVAEYKQQMDRFNLGVPGEADCPVFEGVFKYCQVGIFLTPIPQEMPHSEQPSWVNKKLVPPAWIEGSISKE
jgi:hypothetical protein